MRTIPPIENPYEQEERREYWRWHFAGLIVAGYAGCELELDEIVHDVVVVADALIAELEKEK